MKFFIASVLLAACALQSVPAQSAYVPARGTGSVTVGYSFYSFDEFWFGDTKADLPDPIEQHNVVLGFEYGVTDRLALDLTGGWAYNHFDLQQDHDGLIDTLIGVRYQITNEFEQPGSPLPTLALRLGAIIPGTYDVLTDGSFNSIGDGAAGAEVSLLFGRLIGDTGFGVYGDFGWRIRADNVPQDLFGSFGITKTLWDKVTLRAGYRVTHGLSGKDIFAPDFTFDDFPEVQEILHTVEAGIGYSTQRGDYFQIFAAKTLDGKNTGDKVFVGASATFALGKAGPSELPPPAGKGGGK